MNRKSIKNFSLCFVVFFFGACASYTPFAIDMSNFGPNSTKKTEADLTVCLEEFATRTKCEKVFDTNLQEEGILPLLVLVQNNGEEPYEVRSMDFVIRGNKTTLKALSPGQAAEKAKRNPVGRAVGWSLIVPIISIPVVGNGQSALISDDPQALTSDMRADLTLARFPSRHRKTPFFVICAN